MQKYKVKLDKSDGIAEKFRHELSEITSAEPIQDVPYDSYQLVSTGGPIDLLNDSFDTVLLDIDLYQLLGQKLQVAVTNVPTDLETKTVGRFARLSGNDIVTITQRRTEKQEAPGPRFAHLIKTAIAYLQIPGNFFQYCHSN